MSRFKIGQMVKSIENPGTSSLNGVVEDVLPHHPNFRVRILDLDGKPDPHEGSWTWTVDHHWEDK